MFEPNVLNSELYLDEAESNRNIKNDNLKQHIERTNNKLNYFSVFIDMTTNLYEYTGIQTLTGRLTERSVVET
jgi:hypothetical protein